MNKGKFVAYYRVSTARQGRSGLGLEAQRKAVEDYLNGGGWQIVAEFTEVESGRKADRPELAKALAAARLHKATLVIAKLDRLSRDAHFLLGLHKAGVEFVACDLPSANRLTVTVLAAVAEHEREMISQRTKAALAAAKRRGVKLGGDRGQKPSQTAQEAGRAAIAKRVAARAADLKPTLDELAGLTLQAAADELNRRRIPTARGGGWSPVQVKRAREAAAKPRN
ncbi:MAG: recombinase family protein [Hyphomicrobiales bacterium]|nr:recombinase family protein [Hyphomicrobiales bacterium]